MALIKQSNAATLAKSALVLDLGDLYRQGETILAQARARAEQLLAEAQAERRRLIDQAAEQGRAEGFARGLAEGKEVGAKEGAAAAVEQRRAELDKLAQAWSAAVGDFDARRDGLVRDAGRDVVRLATLIAQRVTRRAIALDESVAIAQVEGALAAVLRPSRVHIAIHPSDRPLVEQALPALLARLANIQHAALVDDAALERGSCVVRLDGSGAEIDASISGQLDRIAEALLPAAPAPAPSPAP